MSLKSAFWIMLSPFILGGWFKKEKKGKKIVRQGGHAQLKIPEESEADLKTRQFLSATNWQITSRVRYPATRSASSMTDLHSSSSLPHRSQFKSVLGVCGQVCLLLSASGWGEYLQLGTQKGGEETLLSVWHGVWLNCICMFPEKFLSKLAS